MSIVGIFLIIMFGHSFFFIENENASQISVATDLSESRDENEHTQHTQSIMVCRLCMPSRFFIRVYALHLVKRWPFCKKKLNRLLDSHFVSHLHVLAFKRSAFIVLLRMLYSSLFATIGHFVYCGYCDDGLHLLAFI